MSKNSRIDSHHNKIIQKNVGLNFERQKAIEEKDNNSSSNNNCQSKATENFSRRHSLSRSLIFSLNFFLRKVFRIINSDSMTLIFLLLLFYTATNVFLSKGTSIAYSLFGPLDDGYIRRQELGEKELSKDKLPEFKRKIRIEREDSLKSSIKALKATEAEKTRLLKQIEDVHKKAKIHLDVTRFFYVQYYLSISLLSNAAIVAAITLLFISKQGWEKSSRKLIYVFVVASGITALFSAFIVVFQYDSNIKDNKQLYIAYTALEDKILSYFSTGQFAIKINPGKPGNLKETVQVIQQIDSEIAALNNIAVGFDSTKVLNYQEVYKGINQ